MPDNDITGPDEGQDSAGPGGQPSPAPEADDDREAQELLAAAAQEADDDDESALDDKGRHLLAKYRREAANLRKQLKAVEPAAQRLKEIEDRDKSEAQKLADQITTLNRQIAEFKVREVRAAAAAEVGLPAHMAAFINADDPDDAKAQAKALLAWGKGSGTTPDLRQGARQTPAAKVTGDELIRRMAGRTP